MMEQRTDIKVRVVNPKMLDDTLQELPMCAAVVMQGNATPGYYQTEDGCYIVSVFGDTGFVLFALEKQGYAKAIEILDQPIR